MSRTRRSSDAEERPSCVPPPPCVPPPLVWKELSEDERKQLLPAHGRQPTVVHDVRRIVSDVRMRGDAALYAWTAQLDRVRPKRLRVPEEAFAQAEQRLSENEKAALQHAKDSITAFHRRQLPDCVELHTSDSHVERLWRPLSRVGLYVPGGEASLPSTMLMLGIPATLAGCSQCAVCTPPKADGLPDAAILYAARLVGLEEVFALGGAQAIAAMAFGTQSVARVDKIFGPGNVWVHEAKRFVGGLAGGPSIDMLAGPSEVLVIADHAARADWIAADLIAQAEHDVLARAILVSPSRDLLARVGVACRSQLSTLPRRRVASVSLADSPWFVSSDLPEAFEVSNFFAPEHLILHVSEPRSWLSRVLHAGSVFLGPWSPEALGDYASGPNHVLPTLGSARMQGGLGVESFCKSMTVQEFDRKGLARLAPTVETLASLEGLEGHRRSVRIRLSEA